MKLSDGKEESSDHVIHNKNEDDRINHSLGDTPTDPSRTTDGLKALIATNHADHDRKEEGFEQAVEEVDWGKSRPEIIKESGTRDPDIVVERGHQSGASETGEEGKNNETRKSNRQSHHPGEDEEMNGINIQSTEGINFLINAH